MREVERKGHGEREREREDRKVDKKSQDKWREENERITRRDIKMG